MKINKKLCFLIVFFGLFLIPNKAFAVYNGSGVDSSGSIGGSCPTFNGALCQYNNTHHKSIIVRLYYISKDAAGQHQWENQIGNSIIITSNASAISLGCPATTGVAKLSCSGYTVFQIPDFAHSEAQQTLMEVQNGVITDMKSQYKTAMGINNYKFKLPTEVPGINNIGYRIIIEPLITAASAKNANGTYNYGLYTIKEAANYNGKGLTNNNRFKDADGNGKINNDFMGVWLYTNINDISINKIGSNTGEAMNAINSYTTPESVRQVVANKWSGYGYNIIDIPNSWKTTCYNIKMNIDPAKCINKGKSNIGTYREEVEDADCDETNVENATENGRLVYEGPSCQIHCLETAQQFFPGNIKDKLGIGTYLIWPTSESSLHFTPFNNNYPLFFSGTRTCKITGSNISGCQNVDSSVIYPFETEAHISWDNGVNASKIQNLESDQIKYEKTVLGDTILVTATKKYYLPENLNRYYDKQNNKSYNYEPSVPFEDIGTANLPISGKATEGFYNLEVINTKLGADNVFGSAASNNKYVCNYELVSKADGCVCPEDSMINAGESIYDNIVRDGISCSEGIQKYCYTSSCECSPGTKYSGKNLVGYLNDSTSCSTAQQLYCDNNNPPGSVCVTCDVGTLHEGMYLMSQEACSKPVLTDADLCDNSNDSNKYCPEPYDTTKNISACIKTGMSYDECVQKICPGTDNEYKCKNTNQAGGKMDITYCVHTKIGQGKTLQEAIDECDRLICPLPNGLRIIYRVIDLSNPFPSYNADRTVSQRGLSIGMFNDTVKGRYPGFNWNSKTVVKTKILNNRNVDGDAVYKKEPLYRFVLTTDTVKEIRKYNKKQAKGYSDFNLNCLNNNSIACVSSFVHNPVYGLADGTCSGKLTKGNFYTCDD